MNTMNTLITIDLAGNLLLVIFGALMLFHLLVILGAIPYNIVWGGRIKNKSQMLKLELISIFVLLTASFIISIELGYVNIIINDLVISGALWVLFFLFCINTLGNIKAENPFEKYVFGFLTTIISLLVLRLPIS